MSEKVVLVCDVCGRPAAESVTFKLGKRSLAQDLCSVHVDELVRNSHTPRRGRRPSPVPDVAGASKRPRPAGRAAASRPSREQAAKGPRRRIADPAILEKRRAALAKARQVLAKKRAATKKAG